jgi:ketosteroid isomerase-like protein
MTELLRRKWRLFAVVGLSVLAGYMLGASAPSALISSVQAKTEKAMPSSDNIREKNVSIVHGALANAKAGKLDQVEPLFPDEFVLYESEGLPFGGIYRGWKGYVEVLDKLKVFFAESKHVDREFLAIDDTRVLVHFTLDAKIAKNGQHFQMPIAAIWELKDGKIVSIRPFFFDTKRISDLAAM